MAQNSFPVLNPNINEIFRDRKSYKSGFLRLKTDANLNWQQYWFNLKGNLLFYSRSIADKDPKGLVVLQDCCISSCGSNIFSILFADSLRRIYLMAADSQEAESWIAALTESKYEWKKCLLDCLSSKSTQ